MPRPQRAPPQALANDDYDGSMPVSRWLTQTPTLSQTQRPLKWALAASILLAGIGGLIAVYLTRPAFIIETAVAENRTIRLDDGSSMTLGGHTRVALRFDDTARQLTLERGEALFNVAKDPARPFSVRAGSATVTAIGTEFNVRRANDRVVVAVVEGRVLVEPRVSLVRQLPLLREPPAQRRLPQHLNAGDQTTVNSAGVESSAHLADAGAAAAWQTGRLAFEREPLRYVLEDVNRYADKPIAIDDAGIGDLKITGTVLSDNIGGWVLSLESAFELRAVQEPDRIVLKRRP